MRAALVVVALLAGCQFDGGLGTGLLCPTGECPDGQVCRDGACTIAAGAEDAAIGAGDAARAADAGPAGQTDGGVGPNLVANPGMEEGIDPWTPFNSTLAESGEEHSGQHSLVVCNGSTGDFTVYQDVVKAPLEEIVAGTRYTASVWVRSLAELPAPGTMMLTIRESGGVVERADHDSPVQGGISSAWIQLQASGTIQESDRENVILIVWALEAGDTACFATDDAVLREE